MNIKMMQKIKIITILFILFFSSSSFSRPLIITPATKREFRAGLIIASKIEEKFPLLKDEEKILRINEIGLRIVAHLKEVRYPYTFNVLDIEDVNAFALPGGFIYLTRGLLDLGLEDSELAFVLGHEIAHIKHNHILKQERLMNLLSLLMMGVEIYALSRGSGEDVREREAARVARSLAYSLSGAMIVRGYSRKHEREADYWGRVYATEAGYGVEGARTLLEKIDVGRKRRPDLFSQLLMTHPYIGDRIEEAKKLIPHFPQTEPDEAKLKETGNLIQSFLIKEASFFKERKELSLLLYRNAYYIYPSGQETGEALYALLKNKENQERNKNKLLRNYNLLIKEYERIINKYSARLELREKVEKKLTQLREERKEVYQWYKERIGAHMEVPYYANFVKFFPASPLIHKARYYLGRKYVSSGEYNKALKEFLIIIEQGTDNKWEEKSREKITPIIDKSTNIILLGKLLNLNFSLKTETKIDSRLNEVIPQVKELQELNHFSGKFPSSPYKELISERMEKLARKLYREARTQHLLGNWQKTVDIYRQILKYAPDTQMAKRVRKEFERLDKIRR